MNKQNVVIIEDEVPAARLLHSMVSRLRPEWNISVLPGSVDELLHGSLPIRIPTLSFLTYNWQMAILLISCLRHIRLRSLFSLLPTTSMLSVRLP